VSRSPTFGVAGALIGLLLLLGLFDRAAAQDTPIGDAIKATYLYKFPPYIGWPDDTVGHAPQFSICVIGADPFGPLLDRAVSGQQIDGRAVVIRRLPAFDPAAGCLIVFAGGSPAQPVPAILAAARRAPVLTVTDGQDGPDKGIINFVIADNRVRFEIDDRAAVQAGFTISSKLLSLALNAQPRN
jgi:hypothetical protein